MGISDAREKVVDMIGTLTGNELFAALADFPDIKVNGLEEPVRPVSVGTTRGSREMVFVAEQNPKCEAAGKKPINAMAFTDGNGAAEALMSKPGRPVLAWLHRDQLFRRPVEGPDEGRRQLHRPELSSACGAAEGLRACRSPLQAAIQYMSSTMAPTPRS